MFEEKQPKRLRLTERGWTVALFLGFLGMIFFPGFFLYLLGIPAY